MGLMVDTNVFVYMERKKSSVDLSSWSGPEPVFISAMTASELLVGVYRADSEERRTRRLTFVESILEHLSILDFTVSTARVHARLCADLVRSGKLIGSHDLVIAATAVEHNLPLLTNNVTEFSRVADLTVIPFKTSSSSEETT